MLGKAFYDQKRKVPTNKVLVELFEQGWNNFLNEGETESWNQNLRTVQINGDRMGERI